MCAKEQRDTTGAGDDLEALLLAAGGGAAPRAEAVAAFALLDAGAVACAGCERDRRSG